MKKFWIFLQKNQGTFFQYESRKLAEEAAKYIASENKQDYVILEAVATTKAPVPNIDIVELK